MVCFCANRSFTTLGPKTDSQPKTQQTTKVTKRQARKAAIEHERARRAAEREAAHQAMLISMAARAARAKAKADQKEKARRDQQRKHENAKESAQQGKGQERTRDSWTKRPYTKHPNQSRHSNQRPNMSTTNLPPSRKLTVAEGMAKHALKWSKWESSLLSLPPKSMASLPPLPHPKLFAMHLTAKVKAPEQEVTTAYRDLIRCWHPDRFHNKYGQYFTTEQKKTLYIKIEEMAKQINSAFGK